MHCTYVLLREADRRFSMETPATSENEWACTPLACAFYECRSNFSRLYG